MVGLFKGLIRVFDHEPTKVPPTECGEGIAHTTCSSQDEAPFDMSLLLKPANYKVRLYILRGIAFTPMDPGWGVSFRPRLHIRIHSNIRIHSSAVVPDKSVKCDRWIRIVCHVYFS